MAERWGIVGGGVLGLTLAHRLAKLGQDVTLFEAADRIGGLASPWTIGDLVWDRHYHVTLLSDTFTRSLLARLGLEREMEWVQTRTGFYTDGHFYSMSSALEFLAFPPLGALEKLRLGATIFYASRIRDWKRLEGISVSDWLLRWSGKRTFEKIWLPLLRSKLGENYTTTSAAFIWATIARMYKARRTGVKKEMLGYLPGGYARVFDEFAKLLARDGVDVKLSHSVTKIQPTKGGLKLEFQNGVISCFDRAVVTLPAPAAAQVCPSFTQDEVSRLQAIPYQGVVCASLLLKRPLGNFYITNITEPGVPFTAVIEMSALVDPILYFGGRSLVYLPKYLPSGDPAFGISDQDLEVEFLAALERMYPQFTSRDVLCFRVSRVRHVLPIPTVNYSDLLPPMKTSVPGLYIVNSSQIVNGTLNVNETIQLAEAAARQLVVSDVPCGVCAPRS
jgi:protoporphyrinogen oxidase